MWPFGHQYWILCWDNHFHISWHSVCLPLQGMAGSRSMWLHSPLVSDTEPYGAQEKPELCLNEAVVIFSASKTSLPSQVPHSSFVSPIEQVHHKLEFLEITKAMDQLHSMTAWFLASWFSTVPVRLYWNWKQFSLRRQGRTCESSAHVLELSDGLSRWRVLLCVVCGSHDCENQRAGRVIKDPMFVDKFYVLICIHGDTCTAATG